MKETVYVFMCAYNAENTIRRSLESIKNQTYHNFLCHVIDHGSQDKTAQIIQGYIDSDKRFSMEYLGQDVGGITVAYAKRVAWQHKEGYFITLDADDEYDVRCFEELLMFMERESLDVGACGNYFISDQTKKIVSERILQEDLIISGTNGDEYFSVYHQFMRTVWAKMYKLSVLKKCFFDFPRELCYGSDTLFVMEAFKQADRIGILSKALHRYYISTKSQSYRFDKKRISSDAILLEYAIDYLFCKYGRVSAYNRNFLFMVYKNAVNDTLKVLVSAKISDLEKISMLYEMVTNHYMRDLCYIEHSSDLFRQIGAYLCSLNIYATKNALEQSAKILAILGLLPSEIFEAPSDKLFLLLITMRRYWLPRDFCLDIDASIAAVAKSVPELENKEPMWLDHFQDIVIDLLRKEKSEALRKVVYFIESECVLCEDDALSLVELGLNLSVQLEEQELFIELKKVQILIFLQMRDVVHAQQALDDWDTILPEDEDFREFRKQLNEEC